MKSTIDKRFSFIVGAFCLVSVIMFARIIMLMTDDNAIRLKAETEDDYNYMTVEVSSERGNIYDRQGYLLAGNTVSYTVALNLQYANGHGDFIAKYIAPIFDLDEDEVREAAEIPYQTGSSVEWTLTNYATKEQIDQLEITKNTLDRSYSGRNDNPEDLDAVIYYPNVHRYYPNDELAFNIIGFYPFMNSNSFASYGIEQYYDDILEAKTISHRFSLDPNVPDRIPDLPNGASIVLTIDRKVQAITEEIIKNAVETNKAVSGTILITNPKTGEVLAMATYPSVNLNEYWETAETFTKDNKYNPAVMQPYEPGSVFKVLTMAIAIDTGAVKPSTVYNDTGTYNVLGTDIYNWDRGAWGPQSMVGCLQHSLNTCMAYLADLVGAETFYEYLDKFGLDDPTGIELAQEDYYPITKPGDSMWTPISLSTASFGQGLMVTPIQMVTAVSALANDGVMMKPHIVREIRYNGEVQKVEPEAVGQPISAETARTVTEMLATSIEIEASDAQVDGIRIAGKTGTGEISVEGEGYVLNTTNASFVGWGPADDPQFIVYVWVQQPEVNIWGSEVSAPVFSEVVEAVAPYLRVPDDNTRECLNTGVCPTEEPEDDDYYYYYYGY
jgi:cell division protein FtsI/penicillin-binding protein 2